MVVTDYRMPRMNGAELIQRIRKLNPNARIILLSGFVEPLGLTEENTGADVVIAKSSNEPAHLTRWVKRLLEPRHAQAARHAEARSPRERKASSALKSGTLRACVRVSFVPSLAVAVLLPSRGPRAAGAARGPAAARSCRAETVARVRPRHRPPSAAG